MGTLRLCRFVSAEPRWAEEAGRLMGPSPEVARMAPAQVGGGAAGSGQDLEGGVGARGLGEARGWPDTCPLAGQSSLVDLPRVHLELTAVP